MLVLIPSKTKPDTLILYQKLHFFILHRFHKDCKRADNIGYRVLFHVPTQSAVCLHSIHPSSGYPTVYSVIRIAQYPVAVASL